MDGVLLVFDSRTLPHLHALTTVRAPLPGRASRRNRMVPAFATLILMLAVGSVYYVSTTRSAAPDDIPPVSIASPTAEVSTQPPPVEAPAAAVPTPSTEPEPKNETQPAATRPKPASPATPTKTTTRTATTKGEPKKDDSKVGSILKKTGKILKKPFKF
jgi:hypothetical protein